MKSAFLASLASYTLCDEVNSVYNITDDCAPFGLYKYS
jgi:hypothetical protein